MMLSVMVVGAGAAFSDQSKIKNTEAVDACTALNIIGGYPDGSFKPEGNITRAEVTKMICVALNGGKNPAVSTNTTPTFSDVRNNANAAWAEGYIESCAAQGIVSGVGGGKFAPNGNVTGVQLAKMLLVSLGYKSENEGFTGNAWATNVNVRAAQKGLYEGLEKMDTSAAITRDNAAQMVWNALQAYEVEYKTTLTTDSKGQLTSQITVQDKVDGNFQKITLMQDKYEAKKVDAGILLTCSKVDGKDYYSITTEDGTSYNANSANNVKALTLLQNMVNAGSLSANASYAAADELQAFANQTCAVSFCWNFSNYSQYADQTQFTPFAMAFPSDDGTPELEMAGPYGFGIFDNKDQAKIDAAKKFIDFVCNDATAGVEAVKTSSFFPVHSDWGDVYADAEDADLRAPFALMSNYLGRYYNLTGGWTEQRALWWPMLAEILTTGADVQTAADNFVSQANANIG